MNHSLLRIKGFFEISKGIFNIRYSDDKLTALTEKSFDELSAFDGGDKFDMVAVEEPGVGKRYFFIYYYEHRFASVYGF